MKNLLLLTCFSAAFLFGTPVRADIYVVVAAASPLRSLSSKEVQALYMGRSRSLPSGEFALVFNLPRDNEVRDTFFQVLTGMNPAQVNSYWSRLIFSGQTMPPQILPSEHAMTEQVKRFPGAIGYLSTPPTEAALRTILILKQP